MVRRMAAVVLALTLYPASVVAQNAVLAGHRSRRPTCTRVRAPPLPSSAMSRAAPCCPVSRNLGSWARVDWPDAPEAVAYVHVTMGRLGAVQRLRVHSRRERPPHRRPPHPQPRTRHLRPRRPRGSRCPASPGASASRCAGEPPRHACHSHLRRWRAGRVNEHLWRDGARVAQRPSRHSARVHARCDDERRRRRPRDVDTARARGGVRVVQSRERLRLDPSVHEVRAECSSPDVEAPGARRPGVRVGQRLGSSRLRGQRADVRGRAAVRAERGARIRSIPDALPRIQARNRLSVSIAGHWCHQVRRARAHAEPPVRRRSSEWSG